MDRASPLELARRLACAVRAPSRTGIIPVCLFLVVCGVLFALGTAGQTPPPTSGDWTIWDSTALQNVTIKIQGNVSIAGQGSLALGNVSLIFIGPGHHELNVSWGTLTVIDSTISSTDGPYAIVVNGEASLYNVTIDGCEGLDVFGMINIIGCTVREARGDAIVVSRPSGVYVQSYLFDGNRIEAPGGMGFNVTVTGTSQFQRLRLVNNSITDAGSDGIHIIDDASTGIVWLVGNRVNASDGNGIFLDLNSTTDALSLDDNSVIGSGIDGVHIKKTGSRSELRRLSNLTSRLNQGMGVHIEALDGPLDSPTFKWWDASENLIAGIRLDNVTHATLLQSTVTNPRAAYDYVCVGSDLDIFFTQHRLASARSSPGHHVVSYHFLNLTAVWQNGEPAYLQHVRFLDEAFKEVFGAISDGTGWLGNYTAWDWDVTSGAVKVRALLHPVMMLKTGNVTGPDLSMGSDVTEAIPFIDSVLPTLLVIGPSNGSHIATPTVTISGACLDEESGPWLVQVSLDPTVDWSDKSWMDTTTINPWTVQLGPLLEGTYDVYIRAFDVANHPDGAFARYVVENLTIDTTPPLILVESPADGLVTNVTTLELRGRTDPEIGSISLDGEPLKVYGGIFYRMLTLADGTTHLSIEAVDLAGNVATASITVTVDRQPPDFLIDGPANGTVTIDEYITVSGTNLRENADRVLVNGVEVQYSGTFSTLVRLDPGWNIITLNFADAAGNRVLETRRVFYDDGPPVVKLLEPHEGAVLGSRTVHVRGTVAHRPVLEVVTVNNATLGVTNLSFEGLILAPADGRFDIMASAVDKNGKIGSAVVSVLIDTLPPVIRTDVADRAVVNTTVLVLEGTVEGASVLMLDGRSVMQELGHFSEQVQLVEGWNVLELVARDAAGNVAEEILHVRLDTVPPVLTIRRPTSVDLMGPKTDSLAFEGWTEPGAKLIFIINGNHTTVLVRDDGNYSFTARLQKGHNSMRLIAMDEAGNRVRQDISVTWNEPEPAIPAEEAIPWVLLIGFTSCTLGAIALASAEVTKFALIAALLPMFTRLKKEEVLDHRLRYAINGLILETPGIHYNAIIKELRLSNGVAVYHLRVLEQRGFIRAVRDGTMKRFYPTAVRLPQDRAPTPEEIRDHIVAIVGSTPGISQKDVAKRLAMEREAVGYHLRELTREGSLKAEKDGRFTTYRKGDGKGQ